MVLNHIQLQSQLWELPLGQAFTGTHAVELDSKGPKQVFVAIVNTSISWEGYEKLASLTSTSHSGLVRRVALSAEALGEGEISGQSVSATASAGGGATGQIATELVLRGTVAQHDAVVRLHSWSCPPKRQEEPTPHQIKVWPLTSQAEAARAASTQKWADLSAEASVTESTAFYDKGIFRGLTRLVCADELPTSYGTLLEAITQRGARSDGAEYLTRMTDYALQVAEAMAFLHHHGVPHGFLTPMSVLLVPHVVEPEPPVFSDPNSRSSKQTNNSAQSDGTASIDGGLPTPPLQPAPTAPPGPQQKPRNVQLGPEASCQERERNHDRKPQLLPPQPPPQPQPRSSQTGQRLQRSELQGARCRLALYGLVNPVDHANGLAVNASEWGSLSYLAPECFAMAPGEAGCEELKRADVNAFGALCFQMVTGVAPYHEYRPPQVLFGLCTGGLELRWPAQPPGGGPGPHPVAPEALRTLVARCMDRDPAARPSFTEVVEVLRNIRRQQAEA